MSRASSFRAILARACWLWLIGLAVSLPSKRCFALTPGVVVVTTPDDAQGRQRAERRLLAELEALGLRVIEAREARARPPGETLRTRLEHLAQQHQAVGAVEILSHDFGLLICVYITEEPVLRLLEVSVEQLSQSDGGVSAVLGAVEVLRDAAVAVESDEPGQASGPVTTDSPPSPTGEPAPTASRSGSWLASLGAGAWASSADTTPTPAFMLGAGYALFRAPIELAAELGLAPLGQEVQEVEPTSRFRLLSLKALVAYSPWSSARLTPAVAVGPTLLFAWHDVPAGAVDSDSVQTLLGAAARLCLGVKVSRAFELRPGLGVTWTARPLSSRVTPQSLSTGEDLTPVTSRYTPIFDVFVQGAWSWN